MRFIVDLHIHSPFSRATSKELTLVNLWVWAQRKGIALMGTGDCIHPGRLAEIEQFLRPTEDGFFELNPVIARDAKIAVPSACVGDVRFLPTTEISCIYKRGGKVRKVHHLICLSGVLAAQRLSKRLGEIGNIRSDGRPILGLDSRDLLELVLETDQQALFIPAHIWTPWFSALGSKSGFDSIEECFGELSKHIHAVETGLSSDPLMNRNVRSLDPYLLISNSDAHSLAKLGREATVFETDFTYAGMHRALTNRADKGLWGTIEFFPEEGKYHLDGHRSCNICLTPEQTRKLGGKCPVCGGAITVGVLSRVELLTSRAQFQPAQTGRQYLSCIPLAELVGEALGVGVTSKSVGLNLERMAQTLGTEFSILLEQSIASIEQAAGIRIAKGIARMRAGDVRLTSGYDGLFGTVKVFS